MIQKVNEKEINNLKSRELESLPKIIQTQRSKKQFKLPYLKYTLFLRIKTNTNSNSNQSGYSNSNQSGYSNSNNKAHLSRMSNDILMHYVQMEVGTLNSTISNTIYT